MFKTVCGSNFHIEYTDTNVCETITIHTTLTNIQIQFSSIQQIHIYLIRHKSSFIFYELKCFNKIF